MNFITHAIIFAATMALAPMAQTSFLNSFGTPKSLGLSTAIMGRGKYRMLGLCFDAGRCIERNLIEFSVAQRNRSMAAWRTREDKSVTRDDFMIAAITDMVDEFCEMFNDKVAMISGECHQPCSASENGVWQTLIQPTLEFVCNQRRQDFKGMLSCTITMTSKNGFSSFLRQNSSTCGANEQLNGRMGDLVKAYHKGDLNVREWNEKIRGEDGFVAAICE